MRPDPMTEEIAERLKLDRPRGILIEQVLDDSPAQDAGLQVFDVILELDGKEMNQSNEVQNAVALKNPGDVVTLKILRDGKERMIRVKLGQRETGRESVQASNEEEYPKLGLEVQNLTDELRSRLGYDEDKEGVLVTSVEPYSTAYDARIRSGDLVIRIEGDRISSVSDYRRALRKYEKGKVVIFYLKRQGTEFHAFVKLPK
jgi:serine protease Do